MAFIVMALKKFEPVRIDRLQWCATSYLISLVLFLFCAPKKAQAGADRAAPVVRLNIFMALYSNGLYSYGLYSYGLYSYGFTWV